MLNLTAILMDLLHVFLWSLVVKNLENRSAFGEVWCHLFWLSMACSFYATLLTVAVTIVIQSLISFMPCTETLVQQQCLHVYAFHILLAWTLRLLVSELLKLSAVFGLDGLRMHMNFKIKLWKTSDRLLHPSLFQILQCMCSKKIDYYPPPHAICTVSYLYSICVHCVNFCILSCRLIVRSCNMLSLCRW